MEEWTFYVLVKHPFLWYSKIYIFETGPRNEFNLASVSSGDLYYNIRHFFQNWLRAILKYHLKSGISNYGNVGIASIIKIIDAYVTCKRSFTAFLSTSWSKTPKPSRRQDSNLFERHLAELSGDELPTRMPCYTVRLGRGTFWTSYSFSETPKKNRVTSFKSFWKDLDKTSRILSGRPTLHRGTIRTLYFCLATLNTFTKLWMSQKSIYQCTNSITPLYTIKNVKKA